MKKILSAFILVFCAASFSSCEKALEKTPDGQITLEKVLSNHDASKGLRDVVYGEVYLRRDQIMFVMSPLEVLTDNAFFATAYNAFNWHNGELSLSNPVINWMWDSPNDRLWPDFWRGIRLANLAIKYLPQSTAISEQECKVWVAECRVLRCWFYLQLLAFYGPIPWIDFPFEATYTGWNELQRPTYDEIATKIEEELLDVIGSGILPTRRPPSEAMYVDNGTAYAIRARVLLYNASLLNNPQKDPAKWQRAQKAAQDVIDLSEYGLVPMSEYKRLFIGAFQTPVTEIIWRSWSDNPAINNSNGIDGGTYEHAAIPHIWSIGESPTQELVDCFEMTNGVIPVAYADATHTRVTVHPEAAKLGYSEDPGGDPYSNRDARFYVNVLYNMADYGIPHNCTEPFIVETYVGAKNGFNEVWSQLTTNSCTGYYSRKDKQVKYFGAGGSGSPEPTHWVFFRLAEFHLQKAEALCELGKLDEALAALNVIRERALQPKLENVPGFQKTADYIMGRIRNERRVEYCLEGQYRFDDQRRWKILNETNRFVTGMRITKGPDGAFRYQRKKVRDYQSYTDKYLVMPIPLEDAKKMTGMKQPPAWQ